MKIITPDSVAIVTIWQEAEGEDYIGKVAIGEVIRNRMEHNYSSDGTVPGTVCKSFQFSSWNDDWRDNARLVASLKLDDTDPVVIDCIRAWNESRTTRYVNGAVLYCNLTLAKPVWAIPDDLVATVGKHSFYLPANLRR